MFEINLIIYYFIRGHSVVGIWPIVDRQPGFTKELCFDTFTDIGNKVSTDVQCNLLIDELSIRKQVEMDNNRKVYDFVLDASNGASDPHKTIPEANDALVFLSIGINGY